MQRIMVLGCCGSGKSSFSKKLHAINKIELFHLDKHYWKPDWKESEPAEWNITVKKLAEKSAWIIDGNYGGTIDHRLKRADTIFFLDYTTLQCLYRITKRTIQYYGTTRPDMTEGCNERFDFDFFHYVAIFNLKKRKKLMNKLNSHKHEKKLYILKNDKQQDQFLKDYAKRYKFNKV